MPRLIGPGAGSPVGCRLLQPNLSAAIGPAPPQPASAPAGAAPAAGSPAAPLVDDATQTLEGLGEAAQAKDDGDRGKARKLQKRAMKDLSDFYATYGTGDGG